MARTSYDLQQKPKIVSVAGCAYAVVGILSAALANTASSVPARSAWRAD